MRANREEHPCRLHDVSVSGAAIWASFDVEIGERVVANFDPLGVLEGTVCRLFAGGFAMTFIATQHKREKIAAQLTWLINRHELKDEGARQHPRAPVVTGPQSLTLAEGIVISCQVLDISISGASVGTPARPTIGSEIKLGNLRAKVVRHHDQGIGVQFCDVQSQNALRRYFG
jgi:hypothetical protein